MAEPNSAVKQYFTRNLKKVIAKFGDVALLDEIGKGNLAKALQDEIDAKASSTDLTALSGKVTTLIGNETGDDTKSARTMAAEEVAKIVAGAPESLDTLKEIADWISQHADDAAAMNSAIVALKAKTVLGTYIPDGQTDPVEYATVKAYVEAYVAQQMADNITLDDLSVGSATGEGNVLTAFTYDSETGVFTPVKGLTAAQLSDLSVAAATGDGNVITGFTYDPQTGIFTPAKGLTAISLTSLSIAANAEGTGNVVTGLSYNNATGVFTVVKGETAVMVDDLVDLTDAEIDALFE